MRPCSSTNFVPRVAPCGTAPRSTGRCTGRSTSRSASQPTAAQQAADDAGAGAA